MATFVSMRTRLALLTGNHFTTSDINAILNRVHQEEVEARAWHRLRSTVALNTVAPITTGTVSISQDGTTVTGVGTSFAAADVGKFIRIDGDDTPIVVASRSSTTSITVGTAWAPAAVSGGTYSLFPLRYALPAGAQKANWIKRTLPLTEATQEWLDYVDPQRTSTASVATHWAAAPRSSADLYQVELWPVATTPVAYTVEYLKGHTDMSADADTPLLPSSVVENKALHDLFMALYGSKAHEPFFALAKTYWTRYVSELDSAVYRDRIQYGTPMELEPTGSVDYDYAVLHDVD